MHDSVAFEVAVYRAKEPELLAARHQELHARLRSYDGFVLSLALRATDETDLFADVVVWSNLEAAEAAAETIGRDAELAWFGPAIAHIALFSHFSAISDPADALTRLVGAPVMELAFYRPASPALHGATHRLLHEAKLPGRDGVAASVGLAGTENDLVGDLVGWASPAAMEATQAALMADPELAGFFEPPAETAVFALFTPSARVAEVR